MKNNLDKDFITYLKEDAKETFGMNYGIYFNYMEMDYEGQCIDEDGKKECFEGTFDELMEIKWKTINNNNRG